MATRLANRRSTALNLGQARRHPVCYAVGMRLWWTCVLWAVWGCYSPTLPLPPPSPPSEASAGTNLVHLTGGPNSAEAGAILLVRNNDPQFKNNAIAATIVRSDGSWDLVVYAVRNDTLEIWQQVG